MEIWIGQEYNQLFFFFSYNTTIFWVSIAQEI